MFYVYGLFDGSTGECFYVGKGSKRRMYIHLQKIRRGTSTDNPHLDHKLQKLLANDIEIGHIKLVANIEDEDTAYALEEQMISEYGLQHLCNVWGGGLGGRVPSEEVRVKIKEGCKKRPLATEETKQKLREAKLGTTQSDETKQKKSQALKGKPQSEAQKAANARRGNKGKPFTEEHKAKLRTAKLNNPTTYWQDRNLTDEHKQRISESVKQHYIDKEQENDTRHEPIPTRP